METEPAVDNMISITDLRRDIDVVKKRLERNRFTWVFRNQKPFFAVVRPDWFRELRRNRKDLAEEEKRRRRRNAYDSIMRIREEADNWNATEVVIKMREEEARKWKKEP